MDIKSVFIHGYLQEGIYIQQPFGLVPRLRKSLYGLMEGPHAWYEKIHNFLLSCGFSCSEVELNLHIFYQDGQILIVVLYVDDFLQSCQSTSMITVLK